MAEPITAHAEVTLDVQLVRVHDFADGDICFVRPAEYMTGDAAAEAGEMLSAVFKRAGVAVQVVILWPGVEVEMLRRAPQGNEVSS